jgi:hypothetical protein
MKSRRLGKKLGDFTYRDPGADVYEAHHRARILRHLRNRAQQHGFGLIHLETGELFEGAVS